MNTGNSDSGNILYFETVLTHSCFIESENLLYMVLKAGAEPELNVVIRNFEETHRAMGERVVAVTIDTRHLDFIKFPREVMDYMSNNPYIKYQLTNALLIRGLGQKILGNFYLNMVRPRVQTRLFTSFQQMLEWQTINDHTLVTGEAAKLLALIR